MYYKHASLNALMTLLYSWVLLYDDYGHDIQFLSIVITGGCLNAVYGRFSLIGEVSKPISYSPFLSSSSCFWSDAIISWLLLSDDSHPVMILVIISFLIPISALSDILVSSLSLITSQLDFSLIHLLLFALISESSLCSSCKL